MTHDGEVIVSFGEDAIQPFFPGDRSNRDVEANLAEGVGDELAGISGVVDRRHIQGDWSACHNTCGNECFACGTLVVWRNIGEIFKPRVGWWHKAADFGAVPCPCNIDEGFFVERLAHRGAHLDVVERRTGVVHAEGDFAVGGAA